MSLTIKVVNYLTKDEKFNITISPNDRIIDIRQEIKRRSAYFSDMSHNRIGLFIFIPKELLIGYEEIKNKKNKKKIIRSENNTFDIKGKYPEKMKLSTKNDFKIFESYPYIINNFKNITLYYYDLGIQINTHLANIIEYLAPIIILFIYIIKFLYFDNNKKLNKIQIWTIIMIIFHYLKRVLESIFVHIQINTMELKMFLIECLYYIIYFGLFSQKQIFKIEKDLDNNLKYYYILFFFISEINNYHCHIILRKIRLQNNNNREIPKGNIFSLIYCANYFWEICSWIFISLFCSLKSIYVFTLIGSLVMTLWALEKKEFYNKMLIKKNKKINKNKIRYILFFATISFKKRIFL